MPSALDGKQWYEDTYRTVTPEWTKSAPASRVPLDNGAGGALYLRQTFDAEKKSAALALELLTERPAKVYLNGELLYNLEALGERPPAWQSVTGEHTIDSPLLHLGLSQRLLRRGQNTLALHVSGRPGTGWNPEESITFRHVEPEEQIRTDTPEDRKWVEAQQL